MIRLGAAAAVGETAAVIASNTSTGLGTRDATGTSIGSGNGSGTGTSGLGGQGCENAYAYGDNTFVQLGVGTRWGWQVTFDLSSETHPIYAAAGNNIINNGTHVDNLTLTRSGPNVNVSYNLFSGFTLNEAHIYVGTSYVSNTAPGSYGKTFEGLSTPTFSQMISGSTGTVYVVAHGIVCGSYL